MNVYQRNPDALPDSAFEPGELHHLVIGNRGRMLDHRRTPVSVVGLRMETGFVGLRIDDFEDAGAEWWLPFEEIDRYQFACGSNRVADDELATLREVVARLDKPMVVPVDDSVRETTLKRVVEAQTKASNWLRDRSGFLRVNAALPDPKTRLGDRRLWADLSAYMRSNGLWNIEESFARQFVSGPHSGEIVKGHQIVLAELGLVPYEGKIVRDPETFAGAWSKNQRAKHIIARLGFMRALFDALGIKSVQLYRGMSIEGRIEPPRNHTFVSASFSRDVAESHFEIGDETMTRVLIAQPVPVGRVFMTYLETEAMNKQFLEAEAALLWVQDGSAI